MTNCWIFIKCLQDHEDPIFICTLNITMHWRMQNAKCEMQSLKANIGSGRSPGGSSGGEAALIGGRQNILILITSMIIISQYWSYYRNIDHIILRSFLIISSHYQWSSRPAAGGSLLGIGSDVGGSLRIPAHFSGFVLSLFFHLSYLVSQRFSPLWYIWNIPSFSYFRLCWAEADHVSWFEEGNENNRENNVLIFWPQKGLLLVSMKGADALA